VILLEDRSHGRKRNDVEVAQQSDVVPDGVGLLVDLRRGRATGALAV
jgi:hypothetical protein